MNIKFNMPIEQESAYESQKGGGGTPPRELWKGLPLEAGITRVNNVLLTLFSPNLWEIFNPTPEVAQKYRLVGSGLQGMLSAQDPLYTFYFKIPVHAVPNFQRADGTIGYSDIICPIEMNKYLVEAMKVNPLFASPVRCAHCEEEKRRWDAHNARWEELGINKRDLSRDAYRSKRDGDPILKATRKAARDVAVRDRYVLSIFDLDKLVGVRPLDEGETGVELQMWLAPSGVKEKLVTFWQAGVNLWENTPQGYPVIGISKDTTGCTGNNMMRTKWDVLSLGRNHPLDDAWLQYVTNPSLVVDPSKFVHMITYEEAVFYLQSAQEDAQGGNAYGQGAPPAASPGANAPGAPVGMPPVTSSPMVPPAGSPVGVPPMGAPPAGPPAMGAPPAGPPMGAPPAGPPMGAPPAGPPAMGAPPAGPPMGAPPAGPPAMGAPPAGPPAMGAPPAGPPAMGAPPAGPPMGAPPAGPPMGAPPAGPPAMGAPPAGPPMGAPPAGPPMGAPPGGPPAMGAPPGGLQMGAPAMPAGAPVPVQPAAPVQMPPVTTIDAASAPPNRAAPAPPPPGEQGPARRRW